MALNKQPFTLNFGQGLDTKTDLHQVPAGRMLALQNTIFDKGGLLQKRNGYGQLPSLPDTTSTYLTTFNGNLTAIGTSLNAYSSSTGAWVAKGSLQPSSVNTLPLIRNSSNQTQADTAVASNGLVCTVYTDTDASGNPVYKYAVANSTTGQNVVAPQLIPSSSSVVEGSRVFNLGSYFIILSTTSTNTLEYVALPIYNPASAGTPTTIEASYVPTPQLSYDATEVSNKLYIAYNTTTGGQSIQVRTLDSTLILSAPVVFSGQIATIMSVTADTSDAIHPTIYVSYFDGASSTGYTFALTTSLNTVFAPVEIISSGQITNVSSTAINGVCTVMQEVYNNYTYDSAIPTHYIKAVTVSSSGTVGTPYVMIRSVGLASKGFIVNNRQYVATAYQSPYQPSYFVIDVGQSVAANPVIVGKLAYSNGGGYLGTGTPNVTVIGNTVYFPYLIKDSITSVNKNTLSPPPVNEVAGIYAQTGINLASIEFGTQGLDTAEIGNDLHLSGGYLSMYDGYSIVEHNFFLWPDSVEATWSASGGNMAAQPLSMTNTDAYFYQVTYEWADNQGNLFRSAPSIPVAVTTTGSGTTGQVTLNIPTLRLTAKTANPVKIVIYRWSVAQQVYYEVTSVALPTYNDLTVDSITYVDTLADSSILGNAILYTTGGVVEDVNAPASNIMTLFDTRLWLVDAEDQNLLWFSKQVIESTPVEMSDLFTVYVSPTVSETTSTGPISALSVMDDKLIIFKKNAIYYINGTGPDNTGANNQYSQPVFITSTVGCENQQSIVLMPQGLMFQSDKGIWLLGRDLSTNYIGAPVEQFNSSLVQSAVAIPTTNQVRFTLESGVTLMYDYYFSQWGTFINVPSISSTVYNNLHTFINSAGAVYQETPGQYLDGSNPVLMSFQTAWFSLAGLQGYERAYYFYLLGTYQSPHKLSIQISYDYNPSPEQLTVISPTNYSPTWGSLPNWGSQSPWGGPTTLEQWRVFMQRQRCQAFSLTVSEIFDPTQGAAAGAGLTLSGLTLIAGLKRGFKPLTNAQSVG